MGYINMRVLAYGLSALLYTEFAAAGDVFVRPAAVNALSDGLYLKLASPPSDCVSTPGGYLFIPAGNAAMIAQALSLDARNAPMGISTDGTTDGRGFCYAIVISTVNP